MWLEEGSRGGQEWKRMTKEVGERRSEVRREEEGRSEAK